MKRIALLAIKAHHRTGGRLPPGPSAITSVAGRRPTLPTRAAALGLVMMLVGCDTAVPSVQAPSTGAPSGQAPLESNPPPSSAGPPAPDSPMPPFELGTELSLPGPTMSEPFDIGQALFDPGRVADAVVSLIALMGIEIRDAAGNVVRPGEDIGAGALVLTESEVRGLVEMAREDLASMNETGNAPVPISALYDALQSSLPPGYSLADFIDGYARAYADDPDALVPQILLGMPISEDAPLTRIQAWLVYIDGFLGRRAQTARTVAFTAQSGASLGSATSFQPPLTSQIPGVSAASWAYLLSRLPTLAYTIQFTMRPPGGVHEGHGSQGQPAAVIATVSLPPPLTDPATGQVLLEPMSSPGGITMRWSSSHPGTLTRHGTLDRALLAPVTTDAGGSVRITFTPKQERADGRGQNVTDVASLYAEVGAAELIRNVYFTAVSSGAITTVLGLARGSVRSRPGNFTIAWHEDDTYEFFIRNKFDVTIALGAGEGPDLMEVRRDGRNEARGVLYNNGDGTYRGAMLGWVLSDMNGDSFVGECHDHTDALQWLYVVGHVLDSEVSPPFVNVTGRRGTKDLELYFYPASPPGGALGACQGTMDFPGGGPDGQPAGSMLPFNDSRWTAIFNTNNWQDGLGLRVYLPSEGTLEMTDNRQNGIDPNIFSLWSIEVTKPPPP